MGIIGHTGSGKSTLIQHLNGLLKPTSGSVLFDGEDIWKDKQFTRQVRFQVGLVFQYPEYQLFEETVYKDISFGPKNMKLSQEEIDRRVREAAEFVELPQSVMELSPFELSGGQKRRVAIAGVIAMEPKVLILDEPTAGLARQRAGGDSAEYPELSVRQAGNRDYGQPLHGGNCRQCGAAGGGQRRPHSHGRHPQRGVLPRGRAGGNGACNSPGNADFPAIKGAGTSGGCFGLYHRSGSCRRWKH